jgi:COMPASS component SPP1
MGLLFEESKLKQDLATCEKEAQNVVERAVLRMWAEKDNAQNGGE